MGASEDRATLREHERVRAASEVTEMMIPGHGIWSASALQRLLDDRKVEAEDRESRRLRDIHAGDPAYEKLYSPRAIRAQEMRDRMWDEDHG